jgi:hypothetical protein
MPHHIAWYIPNKVYYLQIWGETGSEAALDIVSSLGELLGQMPPTPVHGIVDLSRNIPGRLKIGDIIGEAKRLQPLTKYSAWTVVVVDQMAITNKVIAAVAHVLGFPVQFFDETTLAMAFLNEKDASLPPLNALFRAYKAKYFPPESP